MKKNCTYTHSYAHVLNDFISYYTALIYNVPFPRKNRDIQCHKSIDTSSMIRMLSLRL